MLEPGIYKWSYLNHFLTRDPFPGYDNLPQSLNGYNYVNNNPINAVDPTGLILDPSDPSQRGQIIHIMIQTKYLVERSTHIIGIEVPIDYSSLNKNIAIRKFCDSYSGQTYWSIVCSWNPTMDPYTNTPGRADIIDYTEHGLYEIKPIKATQIGILTAQWYIFNYNLKFPLSPLAPGLSFGLTQVIGTDPNDPNKWILAEQGAPGVISYWDRSKRSTDNSTVPVYVYEWNHELKKAQKEPAYAYATNPTLPEIGICIPEPDEDVVWWAVLGYLLWNLKGCVAGPAGCVIDLATPGI